MSQEAQGQAAQRQGKALAAVINQRDNQGAYSYSDDEVRALLTALSVEVARQLPEDELPDGVKQLLVELGERAGITAESTPEQAAEAISAQLAAQEIPAGLQTAVEQFLRELLTAGPEAAQAAVNALLGSKRELKPLQRDAPPPEGAVAAGPMARFAVQAKVKKEE